MKRNQHFYKLLIFIVPSIAFILFPIVFSPDFSLSFNFFRVKPFQRDFFQQILLLVFFYVNYYILVPKFYFKRRYLIFFLTLFVSFLFIVLLPEFIIMNKPHPFPVHHLKEMLPRKQNFFLHHVGLAMVNFLLVSILSISLKIYVLWKQTEMEKNNAEISYLKAQINPHFLFNTLNSIYSLSIQENAKKTANSIIELSSMMRYVLNESNSDYVSLENEIKYIESYIKLQKDRFADSIEVIYSSNGDFLGKKIVPIILIPFIENAFKYGVNPELKSTIEIKIDLIENELIVFVSNKKVKKSNLVDDNHGIGIENTKNRLILMYPNLHELKIEDAENSYTVLLLIKLL